MSERRSSDSSFDSLSIRNGKIVKSSRSLKKKEVDLDSVVNLEMLIVEKREETGENKENVATG